VGPLAPVDPDGAEVDVDVGPVVVVGAVVVVVVVVVVVEVVVGASVVVVVASVVVVLHPQWCSCVVVVTHVVVVQPQCGSTVNAVRSFDAADLVALAPAFWELNTARIRANTPARTSPKPASRATSTFRLRVTGICCSHHRARSDLQRTRARGGSCTTSSGGNRDTYRELIRQTYRGAGGSQRRRRSADAPVPSQKPSARYSGSPIAVACSSTVPTSRASSQSSNVVMTARA
jgi:hypothetical protein